MALFAVGWQRRVDALFADALLVADGSTVETIDFEFVPILVPCIDVGFALGVVVVGTEFVASFVGRGVGA